MCWHITNTCQNLAAHAGTLAEVSLRLKALQSALKRGSSQPQRGQAAATVGNGEAAPGKYAFRTRRAAPGDLAESNFDSELPRT